MISIIIPTLKEEKAIGLILNSLKSNLQIPHEIIVSDGGSRDKTVEIAKQYTNKVVVFSGPNRQTIAQGRNDGAKTATGNFLVFLDADCSIPDPNQFFKIALANFETNKNLVALAGQILVKPEEETRTDKFFFGLMNFLTRIKNNKFNSGDAAGGEFQMIRSDSFKLVNGYREDLVTREDRDLFKRLSKIGKVTSNPELIVYHTGRRAHQVGWSRLVVLFLINTVHFHIFDKVFSKEWTEIR